MAASRRAPAPTREHHDAFCETEEWKLVRGATGRPVTHHRTYELTLWDQRILRTRISKPVDKSAYGASMWSHILKHQLEVMSEEFWACVDDGVRPDRGAPASVVRADAVPLYVYRALRQLGVEEGDILDLDTAGAAALHARLLTEAAGG